MNRMHLYKYIAVDNNVIDGLLNENYIKFSPANQLNDPFEFQPVIKGIYKDEVKERHYEEHLLRSVVTDDKVANKEHFLQIFLQETYKATPGIVQQISFEEFCQSPIKYIQEDTYKKENILRLGVLSLSEKNKDLLMWAHYADEHKGMVIALDKNHAFFKQNITKKDIESTLQKVQYEFVRPEVYLMEIDDREKMLFTKSKHWKYEKEWRAIRILKKRDKEIMGTYLFKFEPTLLRGIYFGMRMPTETKRKIVQIVKGKYSREHLKVYEARMNKAKYQLDFEEIVNWNGYLSS